MNETANRIELGGSERTFRAEESIVGPVDPQKIIRVTAHIIPSKDPTGESRRSFVVDLVDQPASKRTHLSRSDYAKQWGVAREDVQRVRKFASERGLRVVADSAVEQTFANQLGHRTLELEGTVGALSKAFGVELVRVRDQNGNIYRTYNGSISIPQEYGSTIENVFGLDTRPQVAPRFHRLGTRGGFDASAVGAGFTPAQVAEIYNFPTTLTGKGQTIAVIELGGGFRRRDLRTYFSKLGIPHPSISVVNIGRASNSPDGNPDGADAEVMLDIEVAGAVAPGAKFVIYFAPNTNRGFFKAVNTVVNDSLHKPTILSISWGGPESTWTLRDMQSIDTVLQGAAAVGMSVFAAAGDAGSSDGVSGSAAHVDFPASSPFATACGGTKLTVAQDGSVASEIVWNAAADSGTGGGISAVFTPAPKYQTGPGILLPASVNSGAGKGRGVPDIAGNADPATGYKIRVDGVNIVVGGTSAVAPLWAGLFARINEGLGQPAGFVNTLLYSVIASKPGALRDITVGNNDTTGQVGAYQAAPGWDACTGLGTPADGALILQALKSI
jgi:kumamolisin